MITIFNRKELFVTLSMDVQKKLREVLAENKIEYTVKTKNLQERTFSESRRAGTGSFGVNQAVNYEYQIYVRKEDYDQAQLLTSNIEK